MYGRTVADTFRVTDERALAALAHPLRWRLLALLRADGPATATRLAERVHESSGVTSYHLRKLAEFGLVEEDRERGTRRERWWRAMYQVISWTPADFLGSPTAREASVSWRREVYRWQYRLVEQWLAEEPDWDKAWVDAASPNDCAADDDPGVAAGDDGRDLGGGGAVPPQRIPGRTDTARVVWFQHTVPAAGGGAAVTPLSPRSSLRRFLVLTVLRWAPPGLLFPVFVLLPLSRGLTLSELGLAAAPAGAGGVRPRAAHRRARRRDRPAPGPDALGRGRDRRHRAVRGGRLVRRSSPSRSRCWGSTGRSTVDRSRRGTSTRSTPATPTLPSTPA